MLFMNAFGPARRGWITDQLLADIRDRVNIVQIVGEYVRLLPSGKNFKGLCPFHQEKTPSFYVVPAKQIFHCFGCQKGGDVMKFVMEAERLHFPEAVRMLANRAGIAIETEKDPEADARRELYDILEEAAHFFTANLQDSDIGEEVRDYLHDRGIKPETIRRYRMGYARDSWDTLANALGRSGKRVELLQRAGLLKPRLEGSGHYDTFRSRLIIPILDQHQRVVGFGGRVMRKGEEPKYLNSPETEVFNKRRMLFNLPFAMNEIRRENAVIVVEGYLDAISLAQNGVTNVVATLGTAITEDHVAMLARNCERVFFSYDADEAGQKATLRAISLQRQTPLVARVITFPDAKDDPDSFIRREGADAFWQRLAEAPDVYEFLLQTRTHGLPRPLDIPTKERLVAEFRELIPLVQSPVARAELIKKLGRLLDLEPRTLEAALGRGRAISSTQEQQRVRPPAKGQTRYQEWIIKQLLESPEHLDQVRSLVQPEDFSDPALRKLYEYICHYATTAGNQLRPGEIMGAIEDPSLQTALSELIVTLEDQPPQPLLGCAEALSKSRISDRLRDIEHQIKIAEQAGDQNRVNELSREQFGLLKRKMTGR